MVGTAGFACQGLKPLADETGQDALARARPPCPKIRHGAQKAFLLCGSEKGPLARLRMPGAMISDCGPEWKISRGRPDGSGSFVIFAARCVSRRFLVQNCRAWRSMGPLQRKAAGHIFIHPGGRSQTGPSPDCPRASASSAASGGGGAPLGISGKMRSKGTGWACLGKGRWRPLATGVWPLRMAAKIQAMAGQKNFKKSTAILVVGVEVGHCRTGSSITWAELGVVAPATVDSRPRATWRSPRYTGRREGTGVAPGTKGLKAKKRAPCRQGARCLRVRIGKHVKLTDGRDDWI